MSEARPYTANDGLNYKTTLATINRAAACDVTGGVASLNFDATELQIF